MSLLEEIQISLKDIAKVQRKSVRGDSITGMSIVEEAGIESVLECVEKVLEQYLANGEKISTDIVGGEIMDCGKAYFKIKGGWVIEFYEYESTTSLFIRSYCISDGKKEWIAVYVDENSKTAWWDPADED